MANKAIRQKVMFESESGYRYYFRINLRDQEEKLEIRKFDPYIRKHAIFKQKKLPNPKKQN